MSGRQIIVSLTPKHLDDSPDLMEKVASSFPQDDIEFIFKNSTDKVGVPVPHQLLKAAEAALEKQNDELLSNDMRGTTPKPKSNQEWIRGLGREGIKIFFQEAIKALFRYQPPFM